MPSVGDLLAGRYRIDAVLGAGGMASVYRAIDERLGRAVAVKVLLPNLAADPVVAERFEREARALAAAAHPAVVAIYDVEAGDPTTGREPFYVMELCDGGSLADRLGANRRLSPAEVVAAIETVAAGLAELHRGGLIHRDVKPHNILFAGGRPKLADFGLARSQGEGALAALTSDGTTVGTLAYLAPELLAGSRPSSASDVYALGVTAFQALTGRLPRPSGSMSEIIDSRSVPAASVSSVDPELGAFDGSIGRALAIDPAARPTPTEFAARLTDALDRWRSKAAVQDGAQTVGVAVATAVNRGIEAGVHDPGAATLPSILVAGASAAPVRVAPLRRRSSRPISWPRPPRNVPRSLAWLGVGGAALLVVAIALALLGGSPGGARRSPSATASSGPPSASAPATSPVATPTAEATATPSPTVDPAGPALRALNDVGAAIEAAKGGRDGLTGSDANELHTLAGRVGDELRAGDYGAALEATSGLRDRAEKLAKGLTATSRERLLNAIDALAVAIPRG